MDFFQQQELARKSSRRLVGLYALAVIGIAVTVHIVVCAIVALVQTMSVDDSVTVDYVTAWVESLLSPVIFLLTMAGTAVITVTTSIFKMFELSKGGAAVAESMGGREISPRTQDFKEKRLVNVVEEMAIASGVAMPRVYVLPGEKGMNAFAAGFSTKDAAVAVTRGLLDTLNREELQAVIAHEFSHILNGDMRLNIRLIGTLHGIFALAIVGSALLDTARVMGRTSRTISVSRKGKGDNGAGVIFLLGISLWVIGHIGYFFGRLIQGSVSRQREYLADASAVQFTRNPHGIAGALKLIGAVGSTMASPNTMNVSHMLFASGMQSLFATHPPLVKRIKVWDASFNGDFTEASRQLRRRTEETKKEAEDAEQDFWRTMKSVAALGCLTETERSGLHDPATAMCCICGCLISTDAAVLERQRPLLPRRAPNDEELPAACLAWGERVQKWTMKERRVACEMAAGALRNQPLPALDKFLTTVRTLIEADGEVTPFEFAVACMVRRRLRPLKMMTSPTRDAPPVSRTLPEAISRVLSVVACEFEEKAPAEFKRLWDIGAHQMASVCDTLTPCAMETASDMEAFEAALSTLERMAPLIKRTLMEACTAIAKADGTVTDTEETLLFAIADAIDAIGWNTAFTLPQ